jgi:hypothetical protein
MKNAGVSGIFCLSDMRYGITQSYIVLLAPIAARRPYPSSRSHTCYWPITSRDEMSMAQRTALAIPPSASRQ